TASNSSSCDRISNPRVTVHAAGLKRILPGNPSTPRKPPPANGTQGGAERHRHRPEDPHVDDSQCQRERRLTAAILRRKHHDSKRNPAKPKHEPQQLEPSQSEPAWVHRQ